MFSKSSVALFPVLKDTIFLDIETDIEQKRIWLVGINHGGQVSQFWAENWGGQKKILLEFSDYISKYPNHPLVYYSMNHLDIRVIWDLAHQYNLTNLISSLKERYWISLPIFIKKIYDFPVGYSLKELASYLGYQFKSKYSSGVEVSMQYEKMIKRLKNVTPHDIRMLLRYNTYDIKAMEYLIKQFEDDFFYFIPDAHNKKEAVIYLKSKLRINSFKKKYISTGCAPEDLNDILLALLPFGIIHPLIKIGASSVRLTWRTKKEGDSIMITRTKQILDEIYGELEFGTELSGKSTPDPEKIKIREYKPKHIVPDKAITIIKNSDYSSTDKYARILVTKSGIHALLDALSSCGVELKQIHVLSDNIKLRWEGKKAITRLNTIRTS